jgi:hypothetical protein
MCLIAFFQSECQRGSIYSDSRTFCIVASGIWIGNRSSFQRTPLIVLPKIVAREVNNDWLATRQSPLGWEQRGTALDAISTSFNPVSNLPFSNGENGMPPLDGSTNKVLKKVNRSSDANRFQGNANPKCACFGAGQL